MSTVPDSNRRHRNPGFDPRFEVIAWDATSGRAPGKEELFSMRAPARQLLR
jgi:hypothetical protein